LDFSSSVADLDGFSWIIFSLSEVGKNMI